MKGSRSSGLSTIRRAGFVPATSVAVAAIAGGLLIITMTSPASSPRLTARAAAAATACSSYLAQATVSEVPTANPATLVGSYPTTPSNLAAWLLNFDPMGASSMVTSLPATAHVTACVLKGNWNLPYKGGTASASVDYEVVLIFPNGTSSPLLLGQSKIAKAAPPAVGS